MRWYAGLAVEDRKCKVYKLDLVEDESHLLFKCDAYEKIRNDLFGQLGLVPGNIQHNLATVFQKPHVLGKFLKCVLNIQKDIL